MYAFTRPTANGVGMASRWMLVAVAGRTVGRPRVHPGPGPYRRGPTLTQQRNQPSTVGSVGGRRTFGIVLAFLLAFASGAVVLALGDARDYRARAFVIQVPAALAGGAGVELARSERVLHHALALSGVKDITMRELRRRSQAETTSRLDVSLTVEADTPQTAMLLATSYARAFRRAIPDDRGLPTRGLGARRAQRELGPLGWGLIGGLIGLGLGVATAVIRDGLRPGSARAPRRASAPFPHAR
jgi:hypothetical protein